MRRSLKLYILPDDKSSQWQDTLSSEGTNDVLISGISSIPSLDP